MPVFFALALFVSSALLFLVQPLFAKMVLPLLGGTPAVWNTCMVFFQATLLAGYAYAHLAPNWLGVRRQAVLHLGLLLLPFLVLPIALRSDFPPPTEENPLFWLLSLLLFCVGLPFFVVATHGPLLQKWFAGTGHPRARDPYFLYSASNLGSMLALLGYPVLLEPAFSLVGQSHLWSFGYGLLLVLLAGCTVLLFLPRPPCGGEGRDEGVRVAMRRRSPHPQPVAPAAGARGAWIRRLRWIVLAFVPSSLMLSVTTYLTTDIAAIPLLWVIPLAIYLLTFILVFARWPLLPHALLVRILPLVILLLTLVMLSEATDPVWLLVLLHLFALFLVAMICHGELARDRPPAEQLTDYYLWLSLGGVLGGLFNALVAPLLFSSVLEYPLVLVLACLLRPSSADETAESRAGSHFSPARMDVGWPVLLGILTIGWVLLLQMTWPGQKLVEATQALGLERHQANLAWMFGLPIVCCYTLLHRPVRFGLGIGALLLAGAFHQGVHGKVLYRERSFFGVHRVTQDPVGAYHRLVHGNTVHGRQSLDPARRREPLAYYHRTGPIGHVFAAFSGAAAKPHVAVVGLGAGSLAAYGESGQEFTYYEIDPTVVRIARDQRYFTFLHDSAARVDVVLGDARLTLRQAPDRHYGLLVMDAFSSDAIPLHLLTREALQLYLSKLADEGVLAFNISNRYLDLEPILGNLAQDASLVCWSEQDLNLTPTEIETGKAPSHWVVMARQRAHLAMIGRHGPWQEVRGRRGLPVWTDDFSNIFSVFKME